MRNKISVLGRATFVVSLSLTAALFLLTQNTGSLASTVTPVARPSSDAPKDDIAIATKPAQKNGAVARPQARPTLNLASTKADAATDEVTIDLGPLITDESSVSKAPISTVTPSILRPPKRPETFKSANKLDQLNARDRRLYARIFEVQKAGQWNEADRLITQLDNNKLIGHVLYQRYMHPTKYRSRYDELYNWLVEYDDHPGAVDIYKLANLRRPSDAVTSPMKPKRAKRMRGSIEHHITDGARRITKKSRSSAQRNEVRTLTRNIGRKLGQSRPTQALGLLENASAKAWLSQNELDSLRARIAASYLYEGKTGEAKAIALQAWQVSGANIPRAGWVIGLSSWMNGDFINAAQFFSSTSNSAYASGWMKSASAYWAARSYSKLRNKTNQQKWLVKAAQHPRTFYGLIALRALGKDALHNFNWQVPQYSTQHHEILSRIASTNRALDLVESGQHHLAELELRQVYPGANPALQEAMIAFALKKGLPSFALRFGNTYKTQSNQIYDAALYPIGGWAPKNGYQMDKALIHAFIRQESEFNPSAENPSGATGLMQLMPRTASYMADDKNYNGKLGRYLLKDPKENLEIGQKYIKHLMGQSNISKDLFLLAAAYNAGPGNLGKWKQRYAHIEDPLLFVELIPLSETRSFVERVMRNLWIYRQRMGQPTPSLDSIASGSWARYVQLDSDIPFDVASNN